MVAQARAYGLVKDRLRLKDATHIIANIAVPSTIQLVAQTRTRLLASARAYAPQRVAEEEATAEQIRTITADLKDAERLVQRVNQLCQIVHWADELQTTLGAAPPPPEPPRQRFDEALALAHKVLADREPPKAKDQVRRVVDPEARRNKHGEWYDGYLVDMSLDADSELITALNVLPANADEAADAHLLIASEEQAQGNDVQAISMDGAGFRGDVLRDLSDAAGLALDVYAPPSAPTQTGDYFTPADFQLDAAGTLLRCPAEQETLRRQRAQNERGWLFTFTRQPCARCPLLPRCMANSPKKYGRAVLKNDYEAEDATARAKALTTEYQVVREQHPRIERKWAEMVRRHDMRHARYRGRLRVKIQALLTAVVVNIKRIVHLLTDTPRDESALALG
ncbi:MAG: transposase [Chloroflexi bacterium]|nr:transposase [Chloroflexota bacterium]